MATHIISTMLVIDRPEDASSFPQVGLDSSDASFQAVYWRCVACFFATSVRQNQDARHVLYTTAAILPSVEGVEMGELLRRLGVEIAVLPITHRLGRDKVGAWNNVFYILDVVAHLDRAGGFDGAVVMDSDCIWVRPAEGLFADVGRHGVLPMSIPYTYDERLNGASRRDMVRAARQLVGTELDFIPNFSGGELFAATREGLARVNSAAAALWDGLVAARPDAVPVYTEEHLLSLAYEILGIPTGTADPHIRRMWTALRLNNVTAEDVASGRCAWHLPMEKKTGFADLFALVREPHSWLWSAPPDALRERLARIMGIPRRSPRQWAMQVESRVRFHVARRLAGRRPARVVAG